MNFDFRAYVTGEMAACIGSISCAFSVVIVDVFSCLMCDVEE